MGLPEEFGLRESLTLRPLEDIRQLMRRIEEYKCLEDDRLQSKGKAPIINYLRNTGFNLRYRKDLRIQEPGATVKGVNTVFKEPVHRIVERIKNESYFKWPNMMASDPSRRNQNLYCTYHSDKRHTTEQCRVLKDHLEQLVKARHLKEFLTGTGQEVPKGIRASTTKGVLAVVSARGRATKQPPGKKPKYSRQPISFDDDDLEGTTQPHHDALIVMAHVRGFIMKRVMIDQGNRADVMYSDLYRGLSLKRGDLSRYDTPLMGFDGHIVTPEGQISLPVSMGGKEVIVTSIVVASFSLYTAILGRPWIHDMGAIPSTLHVKVKFRTEEGIIVVKGDQQATWQCLVAAADKPTKQTESTKKAPL
ncbi:uncharacterized protein LOC142635703 [Castanea sativa]|uniref:uncharacterized protein LOC142635703 n=1 Tax=Castanea sativa TaxID=21020 RepID=UPI003F64E61B